MSAILAKLLAEHQADAHHEDMCATCKEAQAAIDAARVTLLMAAIDCGHEISNDAVVLHCDPSKLGNALSQLGDRLAKASLA